jgi:ABC-type glycerol-3-phosphate transport system substrate-binding protein
MNKIGHLEKMILVMTLLGATLFSCKSPSPPKEPTIVTFAIPATTTSFTKANFRGLVEAFNQANPDLEVRLRAISIREEMEVNDSYSDILLNKEWGIDAFFSGGFTNYLADSDRILNLQPMLEADPSWQLDDFFPSVLTQSQRGADQWGIPTEFAPLVVFYNRDLFDQAGVVYPHPGWTRDDFLVTAVALRAALPETDFAFAGGVEAAVPFIYAHGGALQDHEWHCTLDDPLTVEALQWYFDLALVHGVMPTLAQVEAYEPELPPNFSVGVGVYIIGNGEVGEGERKVVETEGWLDLAAQRGDAAMWISPLWEQGGWRDVPWAFRWGVAPLPRDVVEMVMFDSYGCYVTLHSQRPQEALRWIQYLTRQRVNIAGIPARRSLAQSADFRAVLPQEIDGAVLDALLAQMERGRSLPLTPIRARAAYCLGEAMIDVYERGENVEAALQKAQQRFSDD